MRSIDQALARECDELAEDVGAPPWVRMGWILPWWQAFGRGRLELFTLRGANEELLAAIPLARSRVTFRSPSNWHTPTFGAVARDEQSRRRLFEGLLANKSAGFTLMFLEDEGADHVAVRFAAATSGQRVLTRVLESSPVVALAQKWDDYESSLPKKIRTELRRRRRRLEEIGALSVVVEDGRRDLDERLNEGFAVEEAGWKGQRGTAIASKPETRRFYGDVAGWAAARGWLRLAYLRLDDRALAFDFAIEHGSSHYLLKTGFDPAFNKYGPGMLLRYEMIKRAFSTNGLASYEFLGRNETWKMQWTEDVRDRVAVQCFPRGAGFAHWAAYKYGRPLAKRMIAAVRSR